MNEAAVFFGIIAYVLVVSSLSRRVALDMDARGNAGWAYGMLTFLIPPLGLLMWRMDRSRTGVAPNPDWRPELGSTGDLLLFALFVITFPWGLIIWFFLNRRTSPDN